MIHFRPAVESDIGFILRTWLDSYRDSPFVKQLPIEVYEQVQKEAIMQLISSNQVLIACVPEDHDILIGFICYNNTNAPTTVHYVYVKFNYRNAGVAQMLLNNIQPTTPMVATQVNKKFYELRSINFLPIITIREFDDLDCTTTKVESFNQWFINHLQEFREHRAEIMKERNARAYRRNNSKRVSTNMHAIGGPCVETQVTQTTTSESHREASPRTQGTISQPSSTRGEIK